MTSIGEADADCQVPGDGQGGSPQPISPKVSLNFLSKSVPFLLTSNTLKHMLNKAVEWGILEQSPARGVKLPRENNRRLRYLSSEKSHALLAACPTQTLQQMVTLALHTGMRKGEILNLRWENVHLREEFIEITEQKNGERSTIPLTEYAAAMLRSVPHRVDSPYVFTGKVAGQPFHDLKRQFEKAVKEAKLDGVTFHTLRHTFASHLVMAGVDLATVKELLRHKSIETTLRYAHLSANHKKAAIQALAASLSGDPRRDLQSA